MAKIVVLTGSVISVPTKELYNQIRILIGEKYQDREILFRN